MRTFLGPVFCPQGTRLTETTFEILIRSADGGTLEFGHFSRAQPQRGIASKPRVARNELPWERLRDVVELGCGYGTFTIPVAKRISGTLTTLDIEEAMVERTRQRAAAAGAFNLVYLVRDVFIGGFGRQAASKDSCLLFNILHCEGPLRLLQEAAKVVKPGGNVLVIHWRRDPSTPRGPAMNIRPRPEQIMEWAAQAGLVAARDLVQDLPPWHYGITFRRGTAAVGE